MTLTRARITRPVRAWLLHTNDWLYELFTCPYCMAHWVAAAFAFAKWDWRNALVMTFLLVTLACGWMGLIMWGVEQMGEAE